MDRPRGLAHHPRRRVVDINAVRALEPPFLPAPRFPGRQASRPARRSPAGAKEGELMTLALLLEAGRHFSDVIPPRELRHPARMAEAQINFASFQIATHLP